MQYVVSHIILLTFLCYFLLLTCKQQSWGCLQVLIGWYCLCGSVDCTLSACFTLDQRLSHEQSEILYASQHDHNSSCVKYIDSGIYRTPLTLAECINENPTRVSSCMGFKGVINTRAACGSHLDGSHIMTQTAKTPTLQLYNIYKHGAQHAHTGYAGCSYIKTKQHNKLTCTRKAPCQSSCVWMQLIKIYYLQVQ